MKEKIVIMGVGNILRGDDGAGSIIAENLKKKIIDKKVKIINAEETPENWIGKIEKISPRTLIIIDAVNFNSFPGDVKIFSIEEIEETTFTTHNFSFSFLFENLKKKTKILIIGIQPGKINIKEGISENVKKGMKKAEIMVENILKQEEEYEKDKDKSR